MKQLTLFTLLCSSVFFMHCSKSNGGDALSGITGNGTFTVAGRTYSGICVAAQSSGAGNNGSDVSIVTDAGDVLTIHNLSTASSGSTNLSDGWDSPAGKTSLIVEARTVSIRGSRAGTGTITKTGGKSFRLSCTVYSIVESGTYTLTASGEYK